MTIDVGGRRTGLGVILEAEPLWDGDASAIINAFSSVYAADFVFLTYNLERTFWQSPEPFLRRNILSKRVVAFCQDVHLDYAAAKAFTSWAFYAGFHSVVLGYNSNNPKCDDLRDCLRHARMKFGRDGVSTWTGETGFHKYDEFLGCVTQASGWQSQNYDENVSYIVWDRGSSLGLHSLDKCPRSAFRGLVGIIFASITELKSFVNNVWPRCLPMKDDRRTIQLLQWEDVPQEPLQPLKDDMTAEQYSSFDGDLSKYSAYEEAILGWMKDLSNGIVKAKVIVVGGGRGGLVESLVKAASRKGDKMTLDVHIIEKNSCAANDIHALLFRCRKNPKWERHKFSVEVGDAREYECRTSSTVELVVSELLGSFGDNELAPECLVNLASLYPEAVFIPKSHTSYVSPCRGFRPWRRLEELKNGHERLSVMHTLGFHVIGEPQAAFTWEYPKMEGIGVEEERITELKWNLEVENCYVTAFCCGFESDLYNGRKIGNVNSPSESWFPAWLPLKEPLWLPKLPKKTQQNAVTMHLRRVRTPNRVYYSWSASSPQIRTIIHNQGGDQDGASLET